jgi:PEGA domain
VGGGREIAAIFCALAADTDTTCPVFGFPALTGRDGPTLWHYAMRTSSAITVDSISYQPNTVKRRTAFHVVLRLFVAGFGALLFTASMSQLQLSASEAVGSLSIESEPAGASVYIDGRLAGETPLTVETLRPGVHRVRLVRLGYLENSRLVTVKAGSRATLRTRLTSPRPQNAPGQAALRIVVLDGEGAVNIIQQKTATAPVIEVRDQNDLPVAGAAVRFGIRSGRAVFGGARTLSVTTDAAGRAVATGFAPTGSGALQITATATFQGQAAAVTIAQTTVTTAAQAAAVSSAGASAGAGAGGGGGLSTTTIGVIAGAAAGGAFVAKELASESGVSYKGNYSGNVNTVFPPSLSFCSRTIAHAGTVQIDIEVGSDGRVTGEGGVEGTTMMVSFSGGNLCAITSATQPHGCCTPAPPVQGTTSSFTFSGSHGNAFVTVTYDFAGSLNGDVVTGTFTLTGVGAGVGAGQLDRGVFPVTLQKQ